MIRNKIRLDKNDFETKCVGLRRLGWVGMGLTMSMKKSPTCLSIQSSKKVLFQCSEGCLHLVEYWEWRGSVWIEIGKGRRVGTGIGYHHKQKHIMDHTSIYAGYSGPHGLKCRILGFSLLPHKRIEEGLPPTTRTPNLDHHLLKFGETMRPLRLAHNLNLPSWRLNAWKAWYINGKTYFKHNYQIRSEPSMKLESQVYLYMKLWILFGSVRFGQQCRDDRKIKTMYSANAKSKRHSLWRQPPTLVWKSADPCKYETMQLHLHVPSLFNSDSDGSAPKSGSIQSGLFVWFLEKSG